MRKPDWAEQLNKYLTKLNTKTFKFGEYDCCIFVADAVLAMTGVDHMAEYRHNYETIEAGNVLLETLGQGSLFETLKSKFGEPLRGCYGRKGDIAFEDDSCGIVLGRSVLFIGEKGHVLFPLRKIPFIFRVT